jgi:hypothetical protein
MLGILKESVHITNKYIILATPLILFSLLSTIYLVLSAGGTNLGIFISVILYFLMFAAFLSGWFFMVVKSVKNTEEDEPNGLIKCFTEGVGEYFLSSVVCILISLFVGTILFVFSTYIGYKLIGNPNVSAQALSSAIVSVDAMKSFLLSLSSEQLMKINLWNLLLFATISFVYFDILFYPAALFFKTKNPIKAFLYSQKDLFSRHFFKNAALYIFLFVLYFIISILAVLGGKNIVMHFLFTLVNFYFMVYAAVLVFNYYYSHYMKIGSKIDEVI